MTAESITEKRATHIKILLDDVEYPKLENDPFGSVIHLSAPRIISNDIISLHGMSFDNDVEGRLSLFKMFRASLHHLCLHSVASDFEIYRDHSGANNSNSKFAMSIVEDFSARAYARSMWPGLLGDIAYSNYLSCLRFRNFDRTPEQLREETDGIGLGSLMHAPLSTADEIAANILSYTSIGKPVTKTDPGITGEITALNSDLFLFETKAWESYSRSPSFFSGEDSRRDELENEIDALNLMKLKLFDNILNIFEKNSATLSTAHSLPHTESYGPNTLFDSHPSSRFETKEHPEILARAMGIVGIEVPPEMKATEDQADIADSESTLGSWEYSMVSQNSLLEQYRRSDPNSHFERLDFPREDYAEFERTRRKLAGQISSLLNQLRAINFSLDESPNQEMGEIDLERAIQATSTDSPFSNIYKSEELLRRDEAWSIVIDSSKSLEVKKKEVRDLAICLSEIAKDLIQKSSWACYSFNDNFHILKDFQEPYDRTVKGRIGGLSNGVKTLLPDAMRLAAQRLIKGPEEVKVMLVVSDGYPVGYPDIEKEMLKTIDWVSNSGILLVGLGIGSSSIRKYFRSNLVVEGTYDLMKRFVQTYAELPNLIL